MHCRKRKFDANPRGDVVFILERGDDDQRRGSVLTQAMGHCLRPGGLSEREGVIGQFPADIVRLCRGDNHIVGIDDDDADNVRLVGISGESLLNAKQIVQNGGRSHHGEGAADRQCAGLRGVYQGVTDFYQSDGGEHRHAKGDQDRHPHTQPEPETPLPHHPEVMKPGHLISCWIQHERRSQRRWSSLPQRKHAQFVDSFPACDARYSPHAHPVGGL